MNSAASHDTGIDAVTGAFRYSGAVIARQLLDRGRRVRTLTGHPQRRPPRSDIEVAPLDFEDPAGLVTSLSGVTTLYNTYWVRFARGKVDHTVAQQNSRTLFEAARRAQVQRVVHISILHASADSPYPYFRGKAHAEQALTDTGLPYAILRPSLLFDERGALVNNIAWMLRRLPVFGVGAGGRYRVRPIHVGDLAKLAIEGASWPESRVVDAVGPERPMLVEMVQQIRAAVGSRAKIVAVPGAALLGLSKVLGAILRDVVLTPEEYRTMEMGLADCDSPATGEVRLSEWLIDHGDALGARYSNAVDTYFR